MASPSNDYIFGTVNGTAFSTADAPTVESLLALVRKLPPPPEPRALILSDARCSATRRVAPHQIVDWLAGENLPNFLTDFDGWWLATLVKHRACKLWSMALPKWDDVMYPATPFKLTRPQVLAPYIT